MMHKHFYAVTDMINKSVTVPDELRYTEKKWIYLESEAPIDPVLVANIELYCAENNLQVRSGKPGKSYLLIIKKDHNV